jgi:two-component system cell cycle sensor histidine kinase/response regulator CckA
LTIATHHSSVPPDPLRPPTEDAAWFRALVEYSPEAAYVVRDGIVLYANPAAVRLFGAPDAAALVGRDILERVHPDDHALAISRRRLVMELNVPAPLVEMRFLTVDGRVVPVEVQATAIHVGDARAIYAAARDISGRRELEEHVRQAQKLEAVGRLAGGIAHDFNNTLAVILGHTEFARTELGEEHPLQEDLRAIQRAAQHSAALTRQLLTYARRQTITPQALDLNESVSAALRMLRPLIGEGIDLEWEPTPGLWPITLDPAQFDQILTNLCANARDAIDGVGTLRIRAANRTLDAASRREIPGAEPGDYVVLTLEDDGRGMSPEILERAFEPFFTTKPDGAGTGLGLATVYGIVRQNHGALTVWSAPGSGTRFDLYFPRRHDEGVAAPPTQAPPAPSGTETVLVVEDEPEILRLATRALRAKGYLVLSALGPVEALHLAHQHPAQIDLLLTDVMMPVMTGPDLARAIAEFRPETRLLFMSGFSADLIARHGRLDAETAFLAKPFALHELVSRVRAVLDRAPRAQSAA